MRQVSNKNGRGVEATLHTTKDVPMSKTSDAVSCAEERIPALFSALFFAVINERSPPAGDTNQDISPVTSRLNRYYTTHLQRVPSRTVLELDG